jgi:hypothetical protein
MERERGGEESEGCSEGHDILLLLLYKIYFSEGSQAVPARPSGKGRLVAAKTFRSEEGSGMGS